MPIPIELLSLFGGRQGAEAGNGLPGGPPAVAPSPPSSPSGSSGPSDQGPSGPAGPEESRPPEQGNGRPG